jgi:hypothetical protein
MAIDNQTLVAVMYVTFLGRAPDAAGLAGWTAVLDGGADPSTIIAGFKNSPEFAHQYGNFGATASDVANREVNRDATGVQGGTPGFVNGAVRNTDTVGPNETAFEWTQTNIMNSAANAGENVAEYNQANGSGAGPVWASVDQVTQTGTGNAIGLEVDIKKPATSTAQAIGIDIVNEGNLDVEVQGGDGDVIWRDRVFPTTCIRSLPGGGLQIQVRGAIVENWV